MKFLLFAGQIDHRKQLAVGMGVPCATQSVTTMMYLKIMAEPRANAANIVYISSGISRPNQNMGKWLKQYPICPQLEQLYVYS